MQRQSLRYYLGKAYENRRTKEGVQQLQERSRKQPTTDTVKHFTTDKEFARQAIPKAESHDRVVCRSKFHAAASSACCAWQRVEQRQRQAHTLDSEVSGEIYILDVGHGCNLSKLVCQHKAARFPVCSKSLHLCLCMPSATCSSQCTTAQWVGQESTSGGQRSGESKAATRIATK